MGRTPPNTYAANGRYDNAPDNTYSNRRYDTAAATTTYSTNRYDPQPQPSLANPGDRSRCSPAIPCTGCRAGIASASPT